MDQLLAYKETYDKKLMRYEIFRKAKETTTLDPVYVFSAIATVVGALAYFIVGPDFLGKLVTFLPPAYKSYKAIESTGTDDDTQWLTYWVVWSFLHLLESYGNILSYIIPYYELVKTVFLVWAWHFVGAQTMYEKCIRPILLADEKYVDAALNKADAALKKGFHSADGSLVGKEQEDTNKNKSE